VAQIENAFYDHGTGIVMEKQQLLKNVKIYQGVTPEHYCQQR
jgi:serine acetyltransferase